MTIVLNQVVGDKEVYGVVLDTGPEQYAVDYEAAEKLREKLRGERR